MADEIFSTKSKYRGYVVGGGGDYWYVNKADMNNILGSGNRKMGGLFSTSWLAKSFIDDAAEDENYKLQRLLDDPTLNEGKRKIIQDRIDELDDRS